MASSIRDSLGFLLPAVSAAEASQRQAASQAKASRAAKWTSKHVPSELLMDSPSLSLQYHQLLFDKDLKGLVRQGIPAELRPTMWFWLSGGYALHFAAPDDLYNRLASSTEDLDDDAVVSIEEGLHTKVDPSFRLNTTYQSGKGSEGLARIMYALLQYRRDLNYSRSLHQIAAFLLIVMGPKNEQQAFWTLVGFLQNKLFPAVNGQVQLGNFIEQGVLELLVQKKMTRLQMHLAKNGWDLADITNTWFSNLFTSHLPPETAVRVWDAVLSEGSKVLHRVALAIIKRHETVIVGCSQKQVMRKILDLRISRTLDEDELMNAAFRGVGSMPGSLLEGFRQQVMNGSAYARFQGAHSARSAMRLEKVASSPGAVAVLNPAAGIKGWLGRSLSRLSNGSYSGAQGARDSASGSQVGSECGYNSDGQESLAHRRRTTSGRPAQNVHFA